MTIHLGGWPGRTVLSDGRFGLLPAELYTGSPPQVCADLPADVDTEFWWVPRAQPSSGTLTANDDGTFSHTGAADGTYTHAFGLYTYPPGGPAVYVGGADGSFETTFGTGTASGLAAALALHTTISASVGAASASGLSATINVGSGVTIGAAVGEAVASGLSAGVAAHVVVAAGVGSATASGLAAGVTLGGTGTGATAAEIWGYVLADGRTAAETLLDNARMMRIILAGIAGKTAGLGTDTETYFGEDETTPRIVASFDSQGNRVSVATDGAP